MLNVVAKAGSM